MHAFWSHGYEATSMSDLVAATGINRGSIYAAYTNKHNLFMETLRHYDRIYRQQFLERVARENAPKDAILAAFEAAATQGNSSKTPGGCLLVNTVLELSPHDADVRDFVDASLREVENFFALMIKHV
jgi:TetR/AcrR family transcriptional repressor of nem operon